MTRAFLCFIVLGLFTAAMYEILYPSKVTMEAPELNPVHEKSFWLSQQDSNKKVKPVSPRYWLDNPGEAWHDADECGDSDDPELYHNKYDGR